MFSLLYNSQMLPYDPDAAIQALGKIDDLLLELIDAVGPCRLPPPPDISPFQYLMHAVLSQQISRKAADAIRGRLHDLFPDATVPSDRDILDCDDNALRGVGISRRKIQTIKHIAREADSGRLPDRHGLDAMDDGAIITLLTQLPGIGVWTAQMLLIFYLWRPDVLPVGDLGIRRGFKIARKLDALPKPSALQLYGERWKPYRSVAAWYLWRANDI